jgi:hypothetical protein
VLGVVEDEGLVAGGFGAGDSLGFVGQPGGEFLVVEDPGSLVAAVDVPAGEQENGLDGDSLAGAGVDDVGDGLGGRDRLLDGVAVGLVAVDLYGVAADSDGGLALAGV